MFDMSRFSLQGKVAIVTGGGRGIGKGIAEGFAKVGAKVVITSRKLNDLEATAAEIRGAGGDCTALQSHLGKLEEINKMVGAVADKFGRIDILVNNAGASPAIADVLNTDERIWETTINLNLRGTYFMSQAAARIMKNQGGGRIINIASVDAYKAEQGVSIYSISKAGVLMVTKAFAKDLAPYNILVNAICPGPIRSKMMDSHWIHLTPEEAEKEIAAAAKATRLGRFGYPEDIAGAAIYLASDAASYTTGAEILIDGGLLL
ncbi:MAG: glucose 1-dehydrogenase [Deltaproteobacteria bacterium]|nr:glucose 1-dehydrogenase [Deltaproteobacteria bacterium]